MSVLRSLSQSLRLSNVYFVGRKSGDFATHLLQNALCTIVPSREYEAFGLVVLESHAAARPVIASDLPGLADLISPHQTGLLVPPEDPAALATAIQHLLQNPAAATQMGHAGQLAAQPYAWPQIARRHADLYAHLLTRPPATA
jgi:glycosyltransferase involved in cell wall biosynthesis